MTFPHPCLAHHAVALIDQILSHPSQPADRLLEHLFREHRLGARERPWVADLVYQVLRQGPPSTPCNPANLVAACLQELHAWTPEQVRETLGNNVTPTPHPPHPLPDWLWQELTTTWGAETHGLAASLMQPATLHLRVNRLKATPENVLSQFQTENLPITPLPGLPGGLRAEYRLPLGEHPLFRNGAVEVQDGGSQRIAPTLDPQPGETVVDLCAGAGGKTLHLAALMNNRGRIWAVDTARERLARLPPRLKRAGVSCVRTLIVRHERDQPLAFLTNKADRVLVDAPCSGTGTLRRHPEIAWRLTPEQVAMYQERQSSLLAAASRLVRPGGRIVYATCSLLQRENDDVVTAFLRDHPNFHPLPVVPILTAHGITCPPATGPFLRVAPHHMDSDGFFMAALTRKR